MPQKFLSEQPVTNHDVLTTPNIDVSVPFFYMFPVMFLLVVLKRPLRKLTNCLFPAGIDNLELIEEKVDDYYDSLTDKARIFMMKEEDRCRNHMNFKIISDESFQDLNIRYKQSIRGTMPKAMAESIKI